MDTTIRKLTGNQKNLHDFMTVFLNKGGGTTPTVVPYDFNEIMSDLNEVVKYDWSGFLNDRVNGVNLSAVNPSPHRADRFSGKLQNGYWLTSSGFILRR